MTAWRLRVHRPQPVAYDFLITDDATWDSTFALGDAALSAKIVAVAAGTYTDREISNLNPSSAVTIRSLSASNQTTLPKLDISSSSRVTIHDIGFVYDNSGGSDFSPNDNFYLLTVNNGNNILVNECYFNSNSGGSGIPARKKRFGGIRATGCASLTVTDGVFEYLRDGIVSSPNNVASGITTATGNSFSYIFEDGITGLSGDWVVNDNTATLFQAANGKRWTHSGVTGTINVGDTLSTGSGTGQKLIEVVAVTGSTIEGYYNSFAKPESGETFSDGGNSVTLTNNGTTAFDGIHGDFFQPLINTSTRDYSVEASRNYLYRTEDFDFTTLNGEQNVQGMLIQLNGSSYNWSTVSVDSNLFTAASPAGITIEGAKTVVARYNLIAEPQYNEGRPDLYVVSCGSVGGVTSQFNVGDNAASGALVVGTGNTGIAIYNDIRMTLANQPTYLTAPQTYPQTKANLSPIAGERLEIGLGPTGPLTTAGEWRATTAPPTMRIVENAATTSGTSTLSSFTAGAGSSRKVIVAVAYSGGGANDATCTWGGVSMTKLANQTTSASNFEGHAIFELNEASFPGGATGNIVATPTGSPTFTSIMAFTIKDCPNATVTPVQDTSTNMSTDRLTAAITPSASSSLVVAVQLISVASSTASWDQGVVPFGAPLSGTRSQTIGLAVQGNAALTCRSSVVTASRGALTLLAFAP